MHFDAIKASIFELSAESDKRARAAAGRGLGALFINGEQEMAVDRVGKGTLEPKSIGSKVLKIKWWATSGPEWRNRSMSRYPEWKDTPAARSNSRRLKWSRLGVGPFYTQQTYKHVLGLSMSKMSSQSK